MVTLEQFIQLVARLRDPKNGCPWDLKQNFNSMIPHLLEESYEVAEAIHTQDHTALREELGDLLLQVVFLSQLAQEEGKFSFQDVLTDIHDKLIFRHPHVFGEQKAQSSEEALTFWEASKASETKRQAHQSILDDIPFALPALTRATKLQKRCAKVGFDWQAPEEVFAKVEEELQEVKAEMQLEPVNTARLNEELGDLLFATVNLCRHYDLDAETSLREGNVKFENRFRKLEKIFKQQGLSLENSTLAEKDFVWNQIKNVE